MGFNLVQYFIGLKLVLAHYRSLDRIFVQEVDDGKEIKDLKLKARRLDLIEGIFD